MIIIKNVIDSRAVTIAKNVKELVEQINETLENHLVTLARFGNHANQHLSKEQVNVLLNLSATQWII
jgi:uncharacterized membrane protein YheB (UPF0754 family)